MKRHIIRLGLSLFFAAASISCGGGSGSSNSGGGSGTTVAPQSLSITIASILSPALEGHPYSTTLTAVNGTGALHWSIAPTAPNALFVTGLSIDANTGIISGSPAFSGTGGFLATVTDSASPAHTASAGFTVTCYSQLTSAQSQTVALSEFRTPVAVQSGISGGFPPVTYFVTSGVMPPGLKFNSTGQLTGAAYQTGTYQFTITAQDSFSTPETATQPFTITVNSPPLSVASMIPARIIVNRPFSGKVIAMGGVSPYTFSQLFSNFQPPGLSFDTSTGILSGTPTAVTGFGGSVTVKDSSSPPQQAFLSIQLTIAAPLGRNDSPTTATAIDNGTYSASISPYIDPPNGALFAGDNDYYKLVSAGGATVHVETNAKRINPNNPLDTVIEIVDGNGVRLSTCRQPGDTGTTFAGSCINDDISTSPHVQDSALDFQVPGQNNTSTTFYVHVFDWRGDARPDMTYNLTVSGVVEVLSIVPITLPAGARGLSYNGQLQSKNGTGQISWSLTSGSLPPGLMMTSVGTIIGTPTTDGTYSFTAQASDSGTPPQTATTQQEITVGEPVKITSTAAWPDACLNQPYSFMVQTTGGVPPLQYGLNGGPWPIYNIDQSTGTYTGTPSIAGTYTVEVTVNDATFTHGDYQHVSLTVKQCP